MHNSARRTTAVIGMLQRAFIYKWRFFNRKWRFFRWKWRLFPWKMMILGRPGVCTLVSSAVMLSLVGAFGAIDQPAAYVFDAVCFVYTCRRLIGLSLVAGTMRRGACVLAWRLWTASCVWPCREIIKPSEKDTRNLKTKRLTRRRD